MKTTPCYLLCLNNRGLPASLESRKVYVSLPDVEAMRLGMVRVVDESGEDYLFPQERFVEITLPPSAQVAFGRKVRPLLMSAKRSGARNPRG